MNKQKLHELVQDPVLRQHIEEENFVPRHQFPLDLVPIRNAVVYQDKSPARSRAFVLSVPRESNIAGSASFASDEKSGMDKYEAKQVALATLPLGYSEHVTTIYSVFPLGLPGFIK